MRRVLLVLLVLVPTASAAAAPTIVAHRGGALADGVPVRAENSLPALEHAAKKGWVLEFDVSLTADRVPVVIHDDKLDRTTNCTGLVKDRTAADLRAQCRIDVLGAGGTLVPYTGAEPIVVPTLAEVLEMAEPYGAVVSPEIKNIPPTTQEEVLEADDFDPNPLGFATIVSEALRASGYPQERMIVQSFWPPNLDVARQHLPAAQLSFLTIAAMNEANPEYAAASRFDWSSPEFADGLSATYVQRAHLYGLGVTVYTPNSAEDIAAAAAAGVDAIITDDAVLAARVLRKQG